jgi:hypothetical protein
MDGHPSSAGDKQVSGPGQDDDDDEDEGDEGYADDDVIMDRSVENQPHNNEETNESNQANSGAGSDSNSGSDDDDDGDDSAYSDAAAGLNEAMGVKDLSHVDERESATSGLDLDAPKHPKPERIDVNSLELGDMIALVDQASASLEDTVNDDDEDVVGQQSSNSHHESTATTTAGDTPTAPTNDADITRWADELLGPSSGDAVATTLTTGIVRKQRTSSFRRDNNKQASEGGGGGGEDRDDAGDGQEGDDDEEEELERQVLFNAEALLGPSTNERLQSSVYPPRFDVHMWSPSRGTRKGGGAGGARNWVATVGFLLGTVLLSACLTAVSVILRSVLRQSRLMRSRKLKVASHEQ